LSVAAPTNTLADKPPVAPGCHGTPLGGSARWRFAFGRGVCSCSLALLISAPVPARWRSGSDKPARCPSRGALGGTGLEPV